MASPHLLWDSGTAYDLFLSLVALHKPADLSVRRAWAAGVRARLPTTCDSLKRFFELGEYEA